MNWFSREPKKEVVEKFTVVELEKPTPLEESPDSISAVASLQSHAGFIWLTRKLAIQASKLKAELENTKQEKLEDYYFLQSGVHWCKWLQQQVDFAHARYLSMRPASTTETMHLQDISSSIEVIGRES